MIVHVQTFMLVMGWRTRNIPYLVHSCESFKAVPMQCLLPDNVYEEYFFSVNFTYHGFNLIMVITLSSREMFENLEVITASRLCSFVWKRLHSPVCRKAFGFQFSFSLLAFSFKMMYLKYRLIKKNTSYLICSIIWDVTLCSFL